MDIHDRPGTDERLREFAQGLRDLRRRAGSPSYRTLAADAGYSSSTLSAAASGDQLPTLTVTLAYVTACRGDVGAWADRWRALSTRLAAEDRASPLEPGGSGGSRLPAEPVAPPRRRTKRVLVLLASLVAILLAGTLLVYRAPPESRDASASVPARAPASPAPPPAAIEPRPDVRAVAGPACPMDSTRQTHISSGSGDLGWREVRGGTWTGDGCDNRFLYSDLTYDPAASTHPENYFQWRFALPSPIARRCGFEVYVPDSANASARVWYDVMDRFEDAQYQVGQFAVDQAANRGRWVSAATIVINTAEVMIMIGGDGRGLPPDRNAVAASPLRLTCSQM